MCVYIHIYIYIYIHIHIYEPLGDEPAPEHRDGHAEGLTPERDWLPAGRRGCEGPLIIMMIFNINNDNHNNNSSSSSCN